MATTPKPSSHFALFVSSVEGRIVSRYGSATAQLAPSMIGCRRTVTSKGNDLHGLERTEVELQWDTAKVVALTPREAQRFRREYRGHLKAGDLVARTAEEFDAQVAADEMAAAKGSKASPGAAAAASGAESGEGAAGAPAG